MRTIFKTERGAVAHAVGGDEAARREAHGEARLGVAPRDLAARAAGPEGARRGVRAEAVIERVVARLARASNYSAEGHWLDVYGRCADCTDPTPAR